MKKLNARSLRTIVILLVMVVIAVGYFTSIGIGNLSGVGFGAIALLCPLGALTSLIAAKLLIPRALISLALGILLIVVFGRVFCAWICPTPLIQRWFPGRKSDKEALKLAAEKTPEGDREAGSQNASLEAPSCVPAGCQSCGTGCAKKRKVALDSRHVVLGGALLSAAIFGFPVFCLICPVGLTFATVLLVMRLFAFGEMTWTIILFVAIIVLELVVFRKWCSKLCPLGAFMSLVSGVNRTFRPHIDDKKCLETSEGIECGICKRACDENIDPRHIEESPMPLSECTKCRECAEACPAGAISFPFLPKKQS